MARPVKIFIFILVSILLLGTLSQPKAQQNALAIFNLRPTNFEAMGYDGEILYAIISALSREKSVQLMPRREMEEILSQKGIVQTDDPQLVSQAGKLLGINFILFGQVTKKGAQIIANIMLMDTQYGQVVKSWQQTFSGREDILTQTPRFTKELARIITRQEQRAAPSSAGPVQPKVTIENLRAESKGKTVVLRWKFDPNEPIVRFHAYRSENPEGPFQFLGKTNKNIFVDKQIKKGRTYYYRIGLITANGSEVKSDETTQIRNAGEKIPHPPLIMSAKGYVRRAEIKFVPSLVNSKERFKIVNYKIYRKTGPASVWANTAEIDAKKTSQTELGFKIDDRNNLDDGKTYSYAVSSVDKKNRESPLSDAVSVKTIGRPSLSLKQDDLLRKIIVAWEPIADVQGYYLYRQIDAETWEQVGKIRGSTKSDFKDDKDLADSQKYRYYLSAYDAHGETGPSNEVEAKTKDLPAFPQNLQVISGMVKSTQISWSPIDDTDIGGYAIYRGFSTKELKLIDKARGYKAHTYRDKGKGYEPLEDGKEYYYALTSYNLYGAEGEISPAVKARTKPRPRSVRGLQLIARQLPDARGYISLAWEQNPEADIKAYIIYRSRNGGYWSKIKELDANQTRYQDNDLSADMAYQYRIIAQDKDGLKSDPVESKSMQSPVIKPKG